MQLSIFKAKMVFHGPRLAFFSIVLLFARGVFAQENFDKAREDFAFAVGLQAYLYAFPLYEMERTKEMLTDPAKLSIPGHAPLGHFFHTKRLLTPRDRLVVTPNNDTIYSSAWLDLSQSPYLLHIPEMGDRYYSFQLIDAWSEVCSILSSRTCGALGGDYCIVGPDWREELPDEIEIIHVRTNTLWIIARILIDGVDDIPQIRRLQEQCILKPVLPQHGQAAANESISHNEEKIPESLRFFDRIGRYLATGQPKSHEIALIAWFHEIGITAEGLDRAALDPATVKGLERVKTAAEDLMHKAFYASSKKINGWTMSCGFKDCEGRYLQRAACAFEALGALTADEAIYPSTETDGDGNQLSGFHCYKLDFKADQLPPVNAFWSLSIYDKKTRTFVENPINRYSIGDRTKGLCYNSDGSLDIYLQHEAPQGHESNWLPVALHSFYLVLRLYNPREDVLEGLWEIPSVTVVE